MECIKNIGINKYVNIIEIISNLIKNLIICLKGKKKNYDSVIPRVETSELEDKLLNLTFNS